MREISDGQGPQSGAAVCTRHHQDRVPRHFRDTDLGMAGALVGGGILLQTGIRIVLRGTIHISHAIEGHGQFLFRHLAWQRRKQ